MSSGFAKLDSELPKGGWPRSATVELLVQQYGIGEMQSLAGVLVPILQSRRSL